MSVNRLYRIICLSLSLFLFACSFNVKQVLSQPKQENVDNKVKYKDLMLFGEVFEKIRNLYVTKPNDRNLIENALQGMLTSLDPHSSYMNEKDTQEFNANTFGSFGGLGIEVTLENGYVKVIAPIEGGAAEKAGVMAGDLIVKIDGASTKGQSLNKSVSKMRGKIGDPITIEVLRKNHKDLLKFDLIRSLVNVKSVTAEAIDQVAYAKISTFSTKTAVDLKSNLDKIIKQITPAKLKGIIIDLRLNSGGLLDQAVQVSDLFLSNGEIVSTKGRIERSNFHFFAKTQDMFKNIPLIVLINGGSASASEIVAGALKDHKRAILLGTKTFGKGSVQTLVPLAKEDGSLRITTALYYTPAGKSIQGAGIKPDIIVEQPLPQDIKDGTFNIGESSLAGHIKGENEVDEEESGSNAYVPKDRAEDVQLKVAIELLHGKIKHEALK
ncbi:S41 family peptidase [Bartonella sp. DGB1]|uniref:S41 family peptidase n=1 Tax=Bartonella sp. DGB1 TaxID=3239807 RepID=UPI0035251A3B